MKQLNKDTDLTQIIKTTRVFEKNNKLHIDYRLHDKYVIKGIGRIRFSLGINFSLKTLQDIEKDATALALEHYLKTNGIRNPNETYLKDIAMEALDEEKDNRADDTHEDYVNIYEKYILPTFGDMLLVNIKAKDIKAWKSNLLNEKRLGKSRFTKYYRTLNFIIKYAYINELIDKNPMELVDKRSKLFNDNTTHDSMKYYSKLEIQKILENATGWFKVYLTTLFYTGMRTGESIALKWSDIDFENNTITIQRNVRHGKVRNTEFFG